MKRRRTSSRRLSRDQGWSRRRLQVLLGLASFVLAALVGGSVWSITDLLADRTSGQQAGGSGSAQAGALLVTGDPDGWSAESLPEPGLGAAQPGELSTDSVGTISLPQPGRLGPAQVATDFPHTREGALAQLIVIDQRALESASVVTAQDVIASWARPGGPTAQDWSGVRAVAILLSAAGLQAAGATDLEVGLRPAMGLFRTVEVGDVVVPCVDFVATIKQTGASTSGAGTGAEGPAGSSPVRVAVADCQRMVWAEGRWMVAPGAEPSPSPSLWPGTQASYDAGYQWLAVSP